MMKLTKVMRVDATPEEILSVVLDDSVNPKGMTMAPVHETPDIEGSVYEWSFKIAGIPQKGIMIVTEHVPAERVSFRNLGALESKSTMTFEPDDGGTRVTMDAEARLTIPLIGRFMDSFLKREMIKNTEWTLRQIEKRHADKEVVTT